MWRWSFITPAILSILLVFSTYVEVIPNHVSRSVGWRCILHVCGGDPRKSGIEMVNKLYSPRMWRWSLFRLLACFLVWVFSTYVEVILSSRNLLLTSERILHVCGGDPMLNDPFAYLLKYSPRMWRWSCTGKFDLSDRLVFSTYVEVIPSSTWKQKVCWSILHVCGGDP